MTFQFKIKLNDISKPPVWRKVQLPAHLSFHHFHLVIQVLFGWENRHLYRFSPTVWKSDFGIAIPDEEFDDPDEVKDSRVIRLDQIFAEPLRNFVYIYDFGDDWIHHILLENITDHILTAPVYLDGKGACPPEDCGGSYGYDILKEALADKHHPDHKSIREWLGLARNERFDPSYVSPADIAARLKEIPLR